MPAVLGAVRIPTELSVTALAGAHPCLLAPAASGDPSVASLHLGPQAELGRILHRLVEDAGRGRMGHVVDADAMVRSRLEVLLRECQRELCKDAFSKAYADLKESFSFLEWHSRTEIAIAEATRMLSGQPSPHSASQLQKAHSIAFTNLNALLGRAGEFTLFEVPFRSKHLRLKGRIDELAKQASGTIDVIDYKTGRVLDADGTLSPRIVFQLRLYGLAILECLPHATVQLYVRSGEEYYSVPFTADDVRRTENEHQALLSRLPPGDEAQAEALAELGPHCRTCRIRHVCPRYQRDAATLWKKPTAEFSLALDIWGTILKGEKSSDGTHAVTLRDASERLVKIHRLDVSEPDVDALVRCPRVWFFNLCSHEGVLKGGAWHHPQNFYQLPVGRVESRAWSMEVFGGNDDKPDH